MPFLSKRYRYDFCFVLFLNLSFSSLLCIASGQVVACYQRHKALRGRDRVENERGHPVDMGEMEAGVPLSVSMDQTQEAYVGRGIGGLIYGGEVL